MKLKVGKKTGLKYFDMAYLRSIGPCYDPSRYLEEDFRGTALDILGNEAIPANDRLWVVLRTDLMSEKVLRLFAVWSCREAIKLLKNPDPRIEACCAVVERFALGQATEAERYAAWSAAESVAESVAESAAWSAAESVAESVAWSAARSAAWYAAWSAAEYAAESAARSAQVNKLREMVIIEGLERVNIKVGN